VFIFRHQNVRQNHNINKINKTSEKLAKFQNLGTTSNKSELHPRIFCLGMLTAIQLKIGEFLEWLSNCYILKNGNEVGYTVEDSRAKRRKKL
jgi:hypothetical protein